jgi:hypothetical protein
MSFKTTDWDAERERHISERYRRLSEERAVELVPDECPIVEIADLRRARNRRLAREATGFGPSGGAA